MELRAANGYYLPSCFFMFIESDGNINTLISENGQTFVHEYIHFLQDITFPYNIRYTQVENRRFQYILLYSQYYKKIEKPFCNWDSDTKITDKQHHSTWGANHFIIEEDEIIDIKTSFHTIYTQARVFKYELILKKNGVYHVGARDFLEYIAHKIENKRWPTSHPEFPYKTIDKIFDFLGYSDIPEDIRICIIEYCMSNDNPANRLHTLLNEDFKNDKDIISSYESCRDFLLDFAWNSVGTGVDDVYSKSKRRLKALRESLNEKYEKKSDSISKWINLIVNYSETYLSNRFIFSEIFNMNDNDFHNFIRKCVSDIGIPLIFNKQHEYISLLPQTLDDNEFIQLYVADAFINYVMSDNDQCSLFDYCKKNNENLVDENCIKKPMIKVHDEIPCPMGEFSLKYGFDKIEWIIE